MQKRIVPVLLPLLLLLAAGCDKPATLYAGLEERQANAVMAALLENDIAAQKNPGEEGTWNVTISEKDFAPAAELLARRGLPQRTIQGVGEVFKKSGMVSSPTEERIRFMDALAQDLSRTISVIDGVVDARVHVVLPENDPFAKNARPSSAAVAIRHRWDADLEDMVPQIKSLVKNAIEGLAYEKISVILFRDPPPAGVKPVGPAVSGDAAPTENGQRSTLPPFNLSTSGWLTPARAALAFAIGCALFLLSLFFFVATLRRTK